MRYRRREHDEPRPRKEKEKEKRGKGTEAAENKEPLSLCIFLIYEQRWAEVCGRKKDRLFRRRRRDCEGEIRQYPT